jgi:hypothetical protein
VLKRIALGIGWALICFVVTAIVCVILLAVAAYLSEKVNAPIEVRRFFLIAPKDGTVGMYLFRAINLLPLIGGLVGFLLAFFGKLPGTRYGLGNTEARK